MISIVICSINAARFEYVRRNLAALLGSEPHEIIGVHDAKSLCEGYNRAIRHARGDAFVFCHDDIEIASHDFGAKLLGHLQKFDLIGVAGTDRVVGPLWSMAGPPYLFGQIANPAPDGKGLDVSIFATPARSVGNIQAIDGVFMAARRNVIEKVGFDEKTFDGFHAYDTDFSYSAHLAGFRVGVACDINIIHASIGNIDAAWTHYANRFNAKYVRVLKSAPLRDFAPTRVRVQSRIEMLEVMNPRWWPPLPPPASPLPTEAPR